MATVKVVDIVDRARTILQDTTNTRWPLLELQYWLNDSYREIVNLRPDANTQTGSFTCAAGTRQVLTDAFPTATRLIDVVRNIAVTSDRSAIRAVERRVLDDQRRTWHAQTQTANIEHFMFDPRLPKEFMVYPPASTQAQLEVVYASVPAEHTLTEQELDNPATAEVIRLDDNYANSMLDYILYRAYTKDAEYTANNSRAVQHYEAFLAGINAKTSTDGAVTPATRTGPQAQMMV